MADLKRAWFLDHSPGRGYTPADEEVLAAKVYAEFQLVSFQTATAYSACVGFCSTGFDLTNPIAIDVNLPQGAGGCIISFRNTVLGWADPTRPETNTGAAHATGDWIGFAIDTISGLAWWVNVTQAPTIWYGSGGAGTASPETGIEGYAFRTGTGLTGNVYLCGGASQPGNADAFHPSVRLNAGAAAFAGTVPSGYVAFNDAAIFNSLDMAPELVLTESGLLVTQSTQIVGSNQPTAFVRSNKYRQQA